MRRQHMAEMHSLVTAHLACERLLFSSLLRVQEIYSSACPELRILRARHVTHRTLRA